MAGFLLRMERISDWIDRHLMRTWAHRLFVGFGSTSLTIGCVVMLFAHPLAKPAIELSQLDITRRSEFTFAFVDRTGAEIGRRGLRINQSVPLADLPDHLINAVIATEDRRFWTHFGLDIIGTLRALLTNLRAGGFVQGGSSITQQVAKNMYLSSERTLSRKISEAFLSLWLEARYTKSEILKLYLDHGYMGSGAFGVEAASQVYFLKSARDLSLAEAALLAGLFQAPAKYAPHVNVSAARLRTAEVLDNMVEAGFITPGRAYWAKLYPAEITYNYNAGLPEYFLDWVYERALEHVKDHDERTFLVRTTLDLAVQRYTDQAVREVLERHGDKYAAREGSAIVLDPLGAVIAMTGGRDYGESQFNRAVEARRQPGSAFKPFVYALAMESGLTPATTMEDRPLKIGKWEPRNYNRKYAGTVSLRRALSRSINTIPIRLTLKLGRRKVVEIANRLGIREELRSDTSIALGTSETTLMSIVSAFGAFGTGGYQVEPYSIVEIRTQDGKLVFDQAERKQQPQRVIDVQVAAHMNAMLNAVVTEGTGRRAALEGIPTAGKTGTSQSYRDAWFVGYTGNLVAGVWFGNDDYTPTNRMTGGTMPAMAWRDIMSFAHNRLKPRALVGVSVDPDRYVSPVELYAAEDVDAGVAFWSPNRVNKETLDVLRKMEAQFVSALDRLNRFTRQGDEGQSDAPLARLGS